MSKIPDCMYDYRPEFPHNISVDTCNECGNQIYTGEEYFDIHGTIICEKCIDNFRKLGGEEN